MKIPASRAESFAKAPDPSLRAVLVHGPDLGLARERAQRLVESAAGRRDDPFRVAERTGAAVAADPAGLLDELGALAFGGGRRAVRLRGAGDSVTEAVERALGEPAWDALLVVEGGDLPARSSLRKLFEGGAGIAALPCYRDDRESLAGLVSDSLKQAGLAIEPDARAFLVARLGGDRALSRGELEKLVLYMGTGGEAAKNITAGEAAKNMTGGEAARNITAGEAARNNDIRRSVTRDDVMASIADASEATLEDLVFAVADGDRAGCVRWTKRCYEEGVAPVALLRAASNHFQRLLFVAALARQGQPVEAALGKLRPPVFWKVKGRFGKQASAWRRTCLAAALSDLLEAETACKSTGAPAEAIAARALLSLAARARA